MARTLEQYLIPPTKKLDIDKNTFIVCEWVLGYVGFSLDLWNLMSNKHFLSGRNWAIIVFGIALAVRLVYLLQIRSNPYFYTPIVDELWHLQWAMDILKSNFWGDDVFFRGPLYPYFLALLLKITSFDYFWSRLLQMILAAGSVSLTYLLGREFFTEWVARIASLFAAFYGTMILYEGMFLIEPLFIFLSLMGFLILARYRDRAHRKPFFWAGLLFGLAAIARPNILLVVLLLAGWIFVHFQTRASSGRAFLILVAFLVGVSLPIIPVTTRNYLVADDFVPISWQGGINLYLGNNTVAEGLTMMMPEIALDARVPWPKFIPVITEYAEKESGRRLKPSQVSAFWSDKAKQFILEHPGKFIGLTFKKLVYFFSGFENSDQTDIYDFRKYSPLISTLIFDGRLRFPFGLLAPLALVGIGLCWPRRRELYPLLIFFLGYVPTVVLFLVTARHRLAVIPIMLLFAAQTIVILWNESRQRHFKKASIIVAVLAALILLSNTNFFDLGFQNPSQIHYNLALASSRKGDYEGALREYQLAIEKAPMAPALYFGLGSTYSLMDRYQDAIEPLSRALSIDPQYTDACIVLGNAYMELGKTEQAELSFRRASALDSNRAEPYINLAEIRLSKNERGQAAQLYRKALRRQPSNHVVCTKLGVLYGQAGDTATAFNYFRRSLNIQPRYAAAYLNWGNISLINGDTTLAIQEYELAIHCDSQMIEPYYNLAILYINLGDLAKARDNVASLLRIKPDFEKGLELQRQLER